MESIGKREKEGGRERDEEAGSEGENDATHRSA